MLRVAGSARSIDSAASFPDTASSGSYSAWHHGVSQPTFAAPAPSATPAPARKIATKRKRKAQQDDGPTETSLAASVTEKPPTKRLKIGVSRTKKVPPVAIAQDSSAKASPAKQPQPNLTPKTLPLPPRAGIVASSRSATPSPRLQAEGVPAPSPKPTTTRWQLEYKPAPRPPLPLHLAGVIIASDIDIIALGRKEYHDAHASKATAVVAESREALKTTNVVKNSRSALVPPVISVPALAIDTLGACESFVLAVFSIMLIHS